jgi:hypothetical protein
MNGRGQYGRQHSFHGHEAPTYGSGGYSVIDQAPRWGHPPFQIVGDAIAPRYAARRRAVQAIFYLHDRVLAPLYVYAEVNGVVDASPAQSEVEARARAAEIARSAGEVYVAVFTVADASWPDPSREMYHAAPSDRTAIAGYVNERGQYGHSRIGTDPTSNSLVIPTTGRDYAEIYQQQVKALLMARGSVHITIAPWTIPRTTNEDVRLLTAYWSKALEDTKAAKRSSSLWSIVTGPFIASKVAPIDVPGEPELSGLKRASKLWRAAVEDVNALAQGNDSGLYVKNTDFWHALQQISTEVFVLAETPTAFDVGLHSTLHYAAHPLEGLEKTYEAGKKEVLKLGWDIGKYLLIGVAAMGGIAVISAVSRGKK